MHNPTLLILVLLPLVGSLGVFALREEQAKLAKQISLVTSLIVAAYAIVVLVDFNTSGPRFQYMFSVTWIKAFGVHIAFGVDGIALVLVAMAVLLVPAVILASWNSLDSKAGAEEIAPATSKRRSVKNYFGLILLLEFFMIGVFTATDVFLFYVFFEAMLVPMYFIIGSFGGPRRQYAAMKFFLYSLVGGLLMLASVIGLYITSGTSTLLDHDADRAPAAERRDAEVAVPRLLHRLRDQGAAHPVPHLAARRRGRGAGRRCRAARRRAGQGGHVRLPALLPAAVPGRVEVLRDPDHVLSVIGILYAAFLAIGQRDMKRMVAYTSVAHFGFIGLGIFAFTTQGGTGAVLYMVNHGFSTGALFIVVGLLIARGKSRNVDDYGGAAKVTPILAGLFLLAGLSALALPGMSTFVSEFLVLVGTFTRYKGFAIVATTGIILAAIYILYLYQRTFQGTVSEKVTKFRDLNAREVFSVAPLIAIIIFLGVYPKPVLDVINPAVKATLSDVHKTDPAPLLGKAQGQGK